MTIRLSKLQKAILKEISKGGTNIHGEHTDWYYWGNRPNFHGTESFRRTLDNRRARFTYADAAATSRSLKRLIDRDLVERKDPDAGRTSHVRLTPKGKEAVNSTMDINRSEGQR